jgi:hypothetical protein
MLRNYSPDELRKLIAGVEGHETFQWEVGTTPVKGSPLGLTYLVGLPAQKASASC